MTSQSPSQMPAVSGICLHAGLIVQITYVEVPEGLGNCHAPGLPRAQMKVSDSDSQGPTAIGKAIFGSDNDP